MSDVIRGERAPAYVVASTALLALVCAGGAIAVAEPWFAHPPAPVPQPPTIVVAPAPPPTTLEPAAPEAPAPAVSAPTPVDCGPHASVFFRHGKAVPTEDPTTVIAPIIAFAKAHTDVKIVVDGHADPSGDELGNLVLSKHRAQLVAVQLTRAGIPANRIVTRAFGAYVPPVGEASTELRRVHIAIRDPRCEEERP